MKTKILLSLFIAFNFCTASAQIVNIPDNNFKQALLTYNPVIDLNNDGQIQVSEALAVTGDLMVNNKNIQDLTGVEAFKNIKILDCGWNQLSTLQLSGLNSLYLLDCYRNNISSLQLSSLPALRSLDCSFNQMTNLQLTGADFPVMDLFRCTDNPLLTNADIHGMPSLDWCEITGNPMLKKLNVSNSPLITKLLAQANNLDSINISGCVAITNLILDQNSLDTIDLSSQINLENLMCSNASLRNLDLRNQASLGNLSCGFNPIESLDLSKCYNLVSFDCGEFTASLKYLNTKNGRPGLTISSVINPASLKYVCANEEDVLPFINFLAQQGVFNVNVNAYCSFTPGGNYNTIKGVVRFDSNNSGCDNNDVPLADLKMNLSHSGQNYNSFTNSGGNYNFYAQTGNYTVKPVLQNPYFTLSPDSASFSFSATNGTVRLQDFCALKNGIHNDLEIAMVPDWHAVAGNSGSYQLILKNKGTETLSGTVSLNYDDSRLNFISATVNPDGQSNGSLTWNFTALKPFESRLITVEFYIEDAPVNYAGDVLIFQSVILPATTDETPADNTFDLQQTIEGPAAPPINISCMEGSVVSVARIGDYIHYRVGFQNTGTDTVKHVVVKDLLDTKLNWNTVQLTQASHACVAKQSQGNNVEFFFENIRLPTKQQDPIRSRGFISFKVKVNSNVLQTDSVLNKAAVYFDGKLPVATNTSKVKFTNVILPTVNLGNDINQCGGVVILNAANPGATYLWNTGAVTQSLQINVSGSYWVKVTNAQGYSASDTINVNIRILPVVQLGNDTSICSGASVLLDAGNAGSSYLWNNNSTARNLTAGLGGLYSVRVTNSSGCSSADTINITLRPKPIVSFSLVDTIYSNAAPILLTGSPAGGQFSGPAVSNGSFDPAVAGTGIHTLQYSYADAYGCNAIATENILVKAAFNSVNIYPNPNRGSFTIVLPDNLRNTVMEIVTASGITVIKKNIYSSQENFKLSLPAGIYYLRLNNTGFSQTTRVIIW